MASITTLTSTQREYSSSIAETVLRWVRVVPRQPLSCQVIQQQCSLEGLESRIDSESLMEWYEKAVSVTII